VQVGTLLQDRSEYNYSYSEVLSVNKRTNRLINGAIPNLFVNSNYNSYSPKRNNFLGCTYLLCYKY